MDRRKLITTPQLEATTMQVYIYRADIYCKDCGEAIRQKLRKRGFAWDDESGYDLDEYPKGPYPDGGGEADYPQHCGSGAWCVNAIELSDGYKIGAWLENPLTSEGIAFVKKEIRDLFTGDGKEVGELWAEWYADVLNM